MEDLITIGVVRLSVEDAESSREQLIRHLKGLSDAGATRLFWDVAARTASMDDRPGLCKALDLVRSGQVREMLVPDVERLTADPIVLETVKLILREHEVPLIALNLGIDLTTDTGELLASISAAGARHELSRIRGRARRNAKFNQMHGKKSRPVFGYKRIDGSIVPNLDPFLCVIETRDEKSKFAIALHQIELFSQYKSCYLTVGAIHNYYGIYDPPKIDRKQIGNEIASEDLAAFKRTKAWQSSLFRWGVSGFAKWILDPQLCGDTVREKYRSDIIDEKGKARKRELKRSEWEITENTHTAMMSRGQQAEFLSLIKANRSIPKGSGSYAKANFFFKKVYCADCGALCVFQSTGTAHRKNTYYGYQCRTWFRERRRLRTDPDAILACTNKKIVDSRKVMTAVQDALCDRAQDALLRMKKDLPTTEDSKSEREIDLESRLRRYRAMNDPYLQGVIEDMEVDLRKERSTRKKEESLLILSDDQYLAYFGDPEYWESLSDEDRRDFLAVFVDRVTISNGIVSAVSLR